jgi:hypothetical protein
LAQFTPGKQGTRFLIAALQSGKAKEKHGVLHRGSSLVGERGMGRRLLFSQSEPMNATDAVRIYVDSRRTMAPRHRNLFGSFREHLGGAIYEGIYDPGSKLSDADGSRKEGMDQVRPTAGAVIRILTPPLPPILRRFI